MGAGVLNRLLMTLLLFALLQPAHAAGWYDSNWTARQIVTISPALADSDLTGFPFLVSITDPTNDVFANAQATGNDILFTAADGTTKLSHEIEFYDPGAGLLYAWVRVPLLSSSADTTLYMYYGNAAAPDQQDVGGTWDSDFVTVQHLQETTGTHFDSTTYNNDGTPQNGVTQNATGQVDGADQFDGSNDLVLVVDDPNLQVVEMTVEAWVYVPGSIPGGFHGITVHAPSSSNWYGLYNNGNRFHYRWSTGAVRRTDFSATFAANQWYYVAGVLDVPNDRVLTYQNETTDTTISGPSLPTPTSGSTRIGTAFASSELFQGFIDEVRISRIARSPAWIRASYRVQNAPEAYMTVEPELALFKRAFSLDGTPIPMGSTLPKGVEFNFLLYINNQNEARTDVSIQDVLDPAFAYQPGTIRDDNTVVACAAAACTPAEEAAIFAAVTAAPLLSDAVDGDVAGLTGGNTIDAGDQNQANVQLDIAANRIWALLFSVKMQ